MNLFTALAGICLVTAFLSPVIGLIFVMLISGDFKLGKPWFEYKVVLTFFFF
jgi:hypothetical protein